MTLSVYDVIAMGGKHLDKEILDTISATQTRIGWDASEYFVYANSAALKKYKITKEDTKRGSVSKVEITVSIILIYKMLFPSICTFATLSSQSRKCGHAALAAPPSLVWTSRSRCGRVGRIGVL
jgi:hypothetical protein